MGGRGSGIWRAAVIGALASCALAVVTAAVLSLLSGPADIAPGVDGAFSRPDTPVALLPLPLADAESALAASAAGDGAFARLTLLPTEPPLPPAPDRALIERTAAGLLPKVAADGTPPSRAYARPFSSADDRPRIVMIVAGIGLSRLPSEVAIARLPGAVVIAIDAYASDPTAWATAARRRGHELLATIPLQSEDAPYLDAGPRAVVPGTGVGPSPQLLRILGSFPGYVGLLVVGRGRLPDDLAAVAPLVATAQERGLLLVDATGPAALLIRASSGATLPRVSVDAVIDAGDDTTAIDQSLRQLEEKARRALFAVGLAHPYPATLTRLRQWLDRLDQNQFVLAPISAIAAAPVKP